MKKNKTNLKGRLATMTKEGEQVLRNPEKEENTFNNLSNSEKRDVAKEAKAMGILASYMAQFL